MATVDECEQALHLLAERMAANTSSGKAGFDRSLTCKLRDLDVIFGGQIARGELTGVTRVDNTAAQVRLDMTSDDLVSLVEGNLKVAAAWASGRIKIDASILDLVRLRSIF